MASPGVKEMSAVSSEFGATERRSGPEPPEESLSRQAKLYLFTVAAIAVVVALVPLSHLKPGSHGWPTFLVLASCAAIAQLFVVRTPRDQSYHTTIVFLIPAAMLLPPELVALMGVVQHIPEWLKVRYPWYIQGFNIANYTLNGLAAWGAVQIVESWNLNPDVTFALAGLAASVVFVTLNHVLLATMLHFARGHTLRETGLFSAESLSTDFVLAALGVAFAAIWTWNPWLLPTAVAPLLLIHRSLSVPALQEEARVDPKTGLFNARYFAAELREELERAGRMDRPMSIIMADLDLLRDINNSYGHLAGDAVLKGIAEVFRKQLRHYDVPARFGGEEFAILLPETPPEQALEIAERIRRAVADRRFEVETSSEPIRATISLGVAGFPKDGTDPNELIHQADLAVYRAKLQGRNRVQGASSEPLLLSPTERPARLAAVPEDGEYASVVSRAMPEQRASERREQAQPRPHTPGRPHFLALSPPVAALVALVSIAGIGAGIAGALFGTNDDLIGLIAIIILVGGGQALSLEMEAGSISVSAVGALAGAALFGPRAALPLAVATVAVEWSSRRDAWYYVCFNIGALSLASLAAAAVFSIGSSDTPDGRARHRRGRPGRRRCVLRRQHRAPLGRDGARRARQVERRLERALLVAPAALRRLRRGRRGDRPRVLGHRSLRPRRLRPPALPHAQDDGHLPRAYREVDEEAPEGRRDHPAAERLARAGEPPPQGALHRGDGEPLGHRRRAGCLHGRPFAPRPAARARHRTRAGAFAGRARPSRARGALPRHREARHPGLRSS